MDPLVRNHLNQARRGHADNGISPIYSSHSFLQHGHGNGSILGVLWRSFVRPLIWQGDKTMG